MDSEKHADSETTPRIMKGLHLSLPLFGCTVAMAVMVMAFVVKASA